VYKLIKWQLREYRGLATKLMLGWLALASVAALGTHLLLGATGDRAVYVLRLLQFGALGGLVFIQYVSYFDFGRHGLPFSAANLLLHVPLPQWRTLVAKVIALLPVLVLYLAADGAVTHITGDIGPFALHNWERVLFATGLFFFCVGFALTSLLLRTIAKARIGLSAALASKWHTRRRPALGLLIDGVWFAANFVVFGLLIVTAEVLSARVDLLAAPHVPGVILLALAAVLTGLNGYLLDHITTQAEI